MNITNKAGASEKSAKDIVFPDTVSGSEKSGASVPRASMVEVTAIGLWILPLKSVIEV
jgi:hypothetical protein